MEFFFGVLEIWKTNHTFWKKATFSDFVYFVLKMRQKWKYLLWHWATFNRQEKDEGKQISYITRKQTLSYNKYKAKYWNESTAETGKLPIADVILPVVLQVDKMKQSITSSPSPPSPIDSNFYRSLCKIGLLQTDVATQYVK